MHAFLATSENVEAIKCFLKNTYPELRASHRIEIFSRACGYKSYAALRVHLLDIDQLPQTTSFSQENFEESAKEMGYSVKTLHRSSFVEEWIEMPDAMWRIFGSGNRQANKDWFQHCRRFGQPMVYIEHKKKSFELNWDCITIDARKDGHVRGPLSSELSRKCFLTFQEVASRQLGKSKAEFLGSSFVGSIRNLDFSTAVELAERFFCMMYDPLRDSKAA